MAKTRIELLNEELDNLTEIIEKAFIERDIFLLLEDDYEEINTEISALMRRKEKVEELIRMFHENIDVLDINIDEENQDETLIHYEFTPEEPIEENISIVQSAVVEPPTMWQ